MLQPAAAMMAALKAQNGHPCSIVEPMTRARAAKSATAKWPARTLKLTGLIYSATLSVAGRGARFACFGPSLRRRVRDARAGLELARNQLEILVHVRQIAGQRLGLIAE